MKTKDVTDRMGVYKRLEDVPDKYRLYQHAAKYRERGVWSEYEDYRHGHDVKSKSTRKRMDRAGRYWKDHMKVRRRHHALPTSDHAEAFFADLLDERALSTVYEDYYIYVEAFFKWLKRRADHPHVYNPVWMAVVENPAGAANQVWQQKVSIR